MGSLAKESDGLGMILVHDGQHTCMARSIVIEESPDGGNPISELKGQAREVFEWVGRSQED